MVDSGRTRGFTESVERRYYLSSLKNDAEQFVKAVRGHWGVENSLHWALDVVFGEDDSRARTGYAAENLVATRRLAVNLLRRDKTCKRSIKGKLMLAAIDPDYLKLILKKRYASALGESWRLGSGGRDEQPDSAAVTAMWGQTFGLPFAEAGVRRTR